ncbi:MAG: PIN domain-containing protein [Candidatus Aminicenantes bacterium]
MNVKSFVDTNIVVYAHDRSSGRKHKIARDILRELWHKRLGILSTQVLQEFFYIVTQKISDPVTLSKAKESIRHLLSWEVVVNDGPSIIRAVDIYEKFKYSFWDSLIIQAAISGKAEILLSEDLQSGQMIDSLKIINPFE